MDRLMTMLLTLPLLLSGCTTHDSADAPDAPDAPDAALAGHDGEARFQTGPGQDALLTLSVPAEGPVHLKVYIHTGESRTLVVDGPGACADREGPSGFAWSPSGSGGMVESYDCGALASGTYNVEIRGGIVLDGSVQATGATVSA